MLYTAEMSTAPPGFHALVAGHRGAVLADPSGAVENLSAKAALKRLSDGPRPLVCHAPSTFLRLGAGSTAAFDLLELFAFVRPARFCRPTPSGIAEALLLDEPQGAEQEALSLQRAAEALLAELAEPEFDREVAAETAREMRSWIWTPHVLRVLEAETPSVMGRAPGLHAWRRIEEWSEHAPTAPPGNQPVSPEEARSRLASLVGSNAEDRPQQGDYASAVSQAFAAREEQGAPSAVLAEAGTGTGKTFGYVAPASLWAERNRGPVWISTFTRNLQRQVDRELDRLHPDPAVKSRKVVVRKGRENYLCLLNFEEAVSRSLPRDAVALGLMARWVEATRDGDMGGGDFPGWLVDLAGARNTTGLADRRGECVYSSCDHYHRCFVEKAARRSRRADIVIANHALVLAQAGASDDGQFPARLVFDEGHHLFDAADGAFSVRLSGREGAELRRWLLGPEDGRRARARGLESRLERIEALDDQSVERVEEIKLAARLLPGPNWDRRISDGKGQGEAEGFLQEVRKQVYARAANPQSRYDLETEAADPVPGLLEAADALNAALDGLILPMKNLAQRLAVVLDEKAKSLDTATRNRIESVSRALQRRVEGELQAWKSMLDALAEGASEEFVDWFSVARRNGRDVDVAMHRHFVDPMLPFAGTVLERTHGVVVTSATLRDSTGDAERDWESAERRTGAVHLEKSALRAQVPSPYDYPAQTRVFVVKDLNKNDEAQVASAYRELFFAADGGGLGLFTAIARLRAVHKLIAPAMEEAGYPLLAQHVDRMDNGSLVEIFRAEERSCLLGTDAMRDGVDVPGHSLRLIVFDRMPWPVPTILHKARRAAFGGNGYDDLVVRLRLKQAFGRLVRRAADAGVFVMLDGRMPSRLSAAFPEGVPIVRAGLSETLAETRKFLASRRSGPAAGDF